MKFYYIVTELFKYTILNFLTKFKDFNFMVPLIFGMLLSIFAFSTLIDFLYKNYTSILNFLIALLMIGYGCFLLINTYLNENISKGKFFYVNIFHIRHHS